MRVGYEPGLVCSDRPRADVLTFEKPVEAAEYLDLDLPGRAVGADEPARFRIPRAAWAPPAPGKKPPETAPQEKKPKRGR